MTPILSTLSEYGARDTARPLPADVAHHAKRAVIDWFSALYPGTRVSPATNLVAAHARELGTGRSSLPGFATTAFPALAAWINGSASHPVEFDDIFKDAVYHPGCPTIAAALAVAEDRGLTGAQLLRAVVVGYEISTRIGVEKLRDRLEKKRRELATREQDLSGRKQVKWAAIGSTALSALGGLLGGRKRGISGALSGARGVLSKIRMESTAETRIEGLTAEIAELEAEITALANVDPARFEERTLVPSKANVKVLRYDVVWIY